MTGTDRAAATASDSTRRSGAGASTVRPSAAGARHASEGREGADGHGDDRHAGAATIGLLVTGMACFGTATPVSAIVGRHLPVWLGSSLRMLVAAVVLVPVLVVIERREGKRTVETFRRLDGGDRIRIAVMAVVGTFGFSALMLLGMRQVPGAVGAVVMATTPAVTALGAVVFLGDRLNPWQGVALALAVAGVVLMNVFADTTQGSGGSLVVGSVLVFLAVCCEATYSLVGKQLSADLSPVAISTASAVLALVLFVPFSIWDALGWSGDAPTAGDWLAVLWWGAGTFALGSFLWFRGMSRSRPAQASAFMAVMPLSALVASYVLLGESFQWVHAVGMALVLAGLAVVVRSGSTAH